MKSSGFTLLEILVVVAIIGILASLSVFSFRDLILRYRVENQIQTLYSDLMNLRLAAMHRNRTCFLVLSQNSYKGYEDSYPSPFGNDTLDGQDNLILPEKRVEFPFSESSTQDVIFDSRGFSKTNKTICVFSTVKPQYDCLKVSKTKLTLGKLKNISGECKSENCEDR
ncbi:MAG: type II secretion system GspH family protein [Deltaproteobacteria bacterium]|nr:type II secretion system GspH family protein [Deltaproteobacteria bacterium]